MENGKEANVCIYKTGTNKKAPVKEPFQRVTLTESFSVSKFYYQLAVYKHMFRLPDLMH